MYDAIKRTLDIVLSGIALIILSPLLILIALLIRLKTGKPILYMQTRAGLHGTPFVLLKFRTMTDEYDINGGLIPISARITGLGAFLRKASLDELPQFINVLKGEMSLVGPRPLFMEYLQHYTDREGKRHDVKPGITGLAQISGRNMLPWDQRLELDVQYVERQSFFLDLSILLRTVLTVVRGRGLAAVPGTVSIRLDDHRQDKRIGGQSDQG